MYHVFVSSFFTMFLFTYLDDKRKRLELHKNYKRRQRRKRKEDVVSKQEKKCLMMNNKQVSKNIALEKYMYNNIQISKY